uniref:HTH psq-type domain-containing protein n=1 Tax=Timema genevievae TaxID=629358 RepID=A0A7R9PLV3_TIMGE|nr:unnamed protein product [Timema genevievae]
MIFGKLWQKEHISDDGQVPKEPVWLKSLFSEHQDIKAFTLENKANIFSDVKRGADVCRKYGLSKSTVSSIVKNKDKMLSALGTNKLRSAD